VRQCIIKKDHHDGFESDARAVRGVPVRVRYFNMTLFGGAGAVFLNFSCAANTVGFFARRCAESAMA
jgi:hypothetical protein